MKLFAVVMGLSVLAGAHDLNALPNAPFTMKAVATRIDEPTTGPAVSLETSVGGMAGNIA